MRNVVLDKALIPIVRESLARGSARPTEEWVMQTVGEDGWDLCKESLKYIKELLSIVDDSRKDKEKIWKNPKVQEMLRQPLGNSVDLSILTKEELHALVEAAFGSRPDLPSGEEYVRQIRRGWGKRLKDLYGG